MNTAFYTRHIGPRETETPAMLSRIGVKSMDELIGQVVPADILNDHDLLLPEGISEAVYLQRLASMAKGNKLFRSYIGMGWYGTCMPAVLQRNILENPAWYTPYTPYQAEISQGRLEALLNFQTMTASLTGMEVANASLLDEGTAAAEAMIMMWHARSRDAVKRGVNRFFIDREVFPATLDVLLTRASALGIELVTGDYTDSELFDETCFGAYVQFPNAKGRLCDYRGFIQRVHEAGALAAVGADLMALVALTPPGEWDADIVLGSTQRFGLPMMNGGPYAAYFATRDSLKRTMPGRIVGITRCANGEEGLRLALQTREQHIKREKATSNICTSQALTATLAGMYGVWHGPEGLRAIAARIHGLADCFARLLQRNGIDELNGQFFDTLRIRLKAARKQQVLRRAHRAGINLNGTEAGVVGISFDETVTWDDFADLAALFDIPAGQIEEIRRQADFNPEKQYAADIRRTTPILTQAVFGAHHSETGMMRYIKQLETKDLSLATAMIPLGSCTMKLNPAAAMIPVTWAAWTQIHPYAPEDQLRGYKTLIQETKSMLGIITGLPYVSLQPNSGAAGEYAGLTVIRGYLDAHGQSSRRVMLIPASAHGTNPASVAMAGLTAVNVPCDENGDIDVEQFEAAAAEYRDTLAGAMITYPSTHGVFEASIVRLVRAVHQNGGLCYMDGANMNAQVGLTSPGRIGADVCHLNLHKTFALPHGGGGPGIGPICVSEKLKDFLPGHPVVSDGTQTAVASSPWGNVGMLAVAHAYLCLMGATGLRKATEYAILNANYIASALRDAYPIVYTNRNGRVAHELILDCKPFKETAGITETDIAKRLMDYGFHAPTLSFPVHGTLMVEPTESEPKAELDRFIEAMLSIRREIDDIAAGRASREDNVLKNAPHTCLHATADTWSHPYSRSEAAYPVPALRQYKYWPACSRTDDAFGDRNFVGIRQD